MEITKTVVLATGIMLSSVVSGNVLADDEGKTYKITITNITAGQSFTPVLAITHKKGHPVFSLGEPASPELAAIAEGGDTSGLAMKIMSSGMGFDSASGTGLIGPGQSESLMVHAKGHYRFVSVAAMLLPTNDGFFALNGLRLPSGKGKVRMVTSPAYDAGSETNDELCANIPGPLCGGAPFSDGDAEGYVHIHPGIQGIGDLQASMYDWKNPVAKITIERMD